MAPKSSTTHACPNCGKPTRGRFCSHCGSLAEASSCASCGGALQPGDRHCPECGAAVGVGGTAASAGAGSSGMDARTAWIVAGIAFTALILVVLLQWASDFRRNDAVGVADVGAMQQGATPMGGAPDITSPQAIDRLYNRIMRLKEEGKQDSVMFFAPMVLQLYQGGTMPPLDADQRYHFGTIANAAGNFDVERLQADSLLAQSPNHLLGLVMAARNARARNDAAAAARFEGQLRQAAAAERAKNLPEYEAHKNEIEAALGQK